MIVLSTRVPVELAEAVAAFAAERRVTPAAVLRALVEDAIDAGELPSIPPTAQALLDREDELLRQLSRG